MSIAGQFYCFLAELVYIMAITISINFVENYDCVILKEISAKESQQGMVFMCITMVLDMKGNG